MKKQLLISAKFDTADFDRSVSEMQRKLKDLYAPADLVRMQTQTAGRLNSMGMGVSGPNQMAQERASIQYRRELDSYIKQEYKKQEDLVKLLGKRDEALKRMVEKHEKMVKGSEKELEIAEKIAKVEENQARKRQEYMQRDQAINQAANIKAQQQNAANPALNFGGMRPPGAGGPSMAAILRAANIAGAMGTAIGVGSEMYGNYTQSPLRTAGNLGSGVQGTVGQDVNTVYGRRSAFEAAFSGERSRAAQMAREASFGNRVAAGGGLMGNILGFGAAGAGTGAAATALGGPLTALGGAAIGGIGGLATGAYRAFNDPAQRSLALSPFSKRYGTEYESIMAGKMGTDYQKALQDLKNQNPGKTMASQYYEQSYMGNLGAQRSMGMGNDQFYGSGGFLGKGVAGGFTPEMMMQMSGGILGAGGSTRGAQGNALFGNQLGRGLDLTNASSVLGSLSGSMGDAQDTRNATIKILAEGMKLGLDDSKFAEENRRFTQMAADIVSRSGATGGDVGRVAGGFGAFVAENTTQGLAGAKTAYEQYQQISSTTTGPRGAMRAAGFMKDEKLSQLSTIEKQALMQMPDADLNESNPLVAGLAASLGITADDLAKRVKGVTGGTVSRFGAADTLRDTLRAKGVDIGRTRDPKYMSSLSIDTQKQVGQLMSYQTTELGYQGVQAMTAFAAGTVGGNQQFGPGASEAGIEAKLATGKGRAEDVTVSETAKDFGIVLQNFRDFKKEIIPSAEAIAAFTGKIREMMIALKSANTEEIPSIIQHYTKQKSLDQTQAGKKGGGP